jgi:hypothetical protein
MAAKQEATVTHDGRTVVDANELFDTDEVKTLLKAIQRIHKARLLRRKAQPPLEPLAQS